MDLAFVLGVVDRAGNKKIRTIRILGKNRMWNLMSNI